MNLDNLAEKSKQVVNNVTNTVEEKGKQVIDRVGQATQTTTSDITEEAIITAVDQAINVMQIANQRVREREIPTENILLEVDVKIAGVIELKMRSDVPKSEKVEAVTSEVQENQPENPPTNSPNQ